MNYQMSEEDPTPTTTQPNEEVVLDKFNEIKERYEKELSSKDEEIAELKKQLEAKDNEVNDTVKSLNDEVNEKLAQAEELNKLRENVQELLNDKAQALVEKYISEGKLVPAQKEKALNLCLADQDMFISLYENAPSIIDTTPKPQSKRISNVEKLGDYFKN